MLNHLAWFQLKVWVPDPTKWKGPKYPYSPHLFHCFCYRYSLTPLNLYHWFKIHISWIGLYHFTSVIPNNFFYPTWIFKNHLYRKQYFWIASTVNTDFCNYFSVIFSCYSVFFFILSVLFRAAIRIQWTKLKTVPIQLNLDEIRYRS